MKKWYKKEKKSILSENERNLLIGCSSLNEAEKVLKQLEIEHLEIKLKVKRGLEEIFDSLPIKNL